MRIKDPVIDDIAYRYITITCECGLIHSITLERLYKIHRWWEVIKCKNCNKRYYSQEECDIFTVLGEEP